MAEKANMGLATTAELLEELTARAEVGGYANYRTVGDEGVMETLRDQAVTLLDYIGQDPSQTLIPDGRVRMLQETLGLSGVDLRFERPSKPLIPTGARAPGWVPIGAPHTEVPGKDYEIVDDRPRLRVQMGQDQVLEVEVLPSTLNQWLEGITFLELLDCSRKTARDVRTLLSGMFLQLIADLTTADQGVTYGATYNAAAGLDAALEQLKKRWPGIDRPMELDQNGGLAFWGRYCEQEAAGADS